MRDMEKWTEHTRKLPPLRVGDTVRIQNQVGPHPKKWDKTGRVIEVMQHDQYRVRVDGSGRITLRNRRFLRNFTPYRPESPTLKVTHDLMSDRRTNNPVNNPTPPAQIHTPPADGKLGSNSPLKHNPPATDMTSDKPPSGAQEPPPCRTVTDIGVPESAVLMPGPKDPAGDSPPSPTTVGRPRRVVKPPDFLRYDANFDMIRSGT